MLNVKHWFASRAGLQAIAVQASHVIIRQYMKDALFLA
jgi:hypothetical protein